MHQKCCSNIRFRTGINNRTAMTRVPICSWCDINVSETLFINYPGNDKLKRSFCSEKCFELSRRVSFKRGKACDWCDKISLIENGTKSGSEYSSTSKLSNKSESSESNENGVIASIEQLHFCNNLCLNNYKKNVFEKETSDVLLVKKEDHIGDIDVETVSISKQSDDKKISMGIKSNSFPSKVVKNISITPLKKSRCSSFTKFHKSNKRAFSNENSHSNPIQNMKTHNINPIYHSFNNYNDFLSTRSNPSLGNFNLQPKSNEGIKIPVSGPLYIPVPIPIPIPIFKNAPEIIDILYKYGYRQTQNVKENQTSKSPIMSNKANQVSLISNPEPQTEALDLSGTTENRIENSSQNQINLTTSFPITSILHLNDPYLKRRNRILDAPTPPNLSGFNYSSRIKNYSLNYAEISSSAQLKPAKYSKKKMEKSPNYNKTSNKTQSPRPLIQTAKSLLRRYPLISLRRNIKSAPSSVIDANIK